MERWVAKIIALICVLFIPLGFTLLPIKVHDIFVRKGKRGKEVLSWLMCFGGGVFFATYLLHMGPEVTLILNNALIIPYNIDYPVAELIVSIGFFLVLFIEKVAMRTQRGSAKKAKRMSNSCPKKRMCFKDLKNMKANGDVGPCKANVDSNVIALMKKELDRDNNDVNIYIEDGQEDEKPHTSRSLVLAIALSLHRIFEGMSVGLKHTTKGVLSLLLAVICHEIVIGFSLGLQFVQNKFTLRRTVMFTVVCSIIMPLGVALGTIIMELGSENRALEITNGVLQAMSTGTFIYVTFFEILQGEISHQDTSILKLFFVLFGFGVMAGLSAIPEPDEILDHILINQTRLEMSTVAT